MKSSLVLKTLVGKVLKIPGTDNLYHVISWNFENDCYELENFHKRYEKLIISRFYLMTLLDSKLASILI